MNTAPVIAAAARTTVNGFEYIEVTITHHSTVSALVLAGYTCWIISA